MTQPVYRRISARELGTRVASRVTNTNDDSAYSALMLSGAHSLKDAVESLASWAARHHNDDMAALHAVVQEIERTILEGPLALASPSPGTPEPLTIAHAPVEGY